MSQDPLALAAFTSEARHEAEYDAVYAAVTATERGRWFLSEYATRNRSADTDLVVAALARIEAAIGSGGALRSPAPSDHTEIAAANGRLGADVTETVPITKIIVAAERIADISFRLRESVVDAALCDDIEGAAREIYQACGLGTVDPTTSAAEVPAPSGEIRADIVMPSEQNPSALVATSELLDVAAPAVDDGVDIESPVASLVDDTPRWHIEGPDFLFQPDAKEPDQESVAPTSRLEQKHLLLPETLFQPGPKDDPAELFDKANSVAALSAAAASEAANTPDQTRAQNFAPDHAQAVAQGESRGGVRPLRVVTSTVLRPLSRPVSNDPRGTIRDLSEEELIALFG
jgi:hypothetical protein